MIFSVFSPMEPVFFEKIAPLQRWPLGEDLSVALRPEKRPIGDHGSQPNAAGAVVRWSGWEVVRNPETINIYIYITANLSHMICLILFIFKYIYMYTHICIYRLDVKVFFPTWWGPLDFIRAACRSSSSTLTSISQPDHKKIISRSYPYRIWF